MVYVSFRCAECVCYTHYTHTHTHTHIHIHTHKHKYTHTNTHIHTYTHRDAHAHTCTYTHAHTQIHTYTFIHTCTHIHTRVHTHMHAHTHTHPSVWGFLTPRHHRAWVLLPVMSGRVSSITCFMQSSACVNPDLPTHPTPFPPVGVHTFILYVCYANRLICTIFLDSTHTL